MDKGSTSRKCGKVRRTLFHLLLIMGGVTGLKDLTINVPAMVRSGDTVTLTCSYDLEGSPLYSIQWSLEEVEFYRYMTERIPSKSAYNVSGIHVNVNASDHVSVTLVDVTRNLTGMYKCEVSAGKPLYHTLIKRAEMMVVDAPKTDPTIGSEKERVAVGETLRANCTSGASRPASAITWILNGDPITSNDSQFEIRPYSIHLEDDNVKTKSNIEFKITNDMFRDGRLRLSCIAFISDVYRKSADMEIAVDEPLIASITGDASPHSHTESSASVVTNQQVWYSTAMTSIALATVILAMTEALTSGRLTSAVLGTR
ncbi:PREDICTED: synaptogenesis protein syg-2-like isoform X1 [Polistes canadensis]|uniref:synaptogenesis protein syg-2-like isoform X1 n=1 Tax=Polistes canadensis TaxID=91411 RepID=UPI000718BC87|nr:PREDICTED: synaptogenesis protein syg-2-like isoform X1 [Polistes canadensis]